MSVKVEIKIDAEAMADFMIYHIYTSKVGILAFILGILNIGVSVVFMMKKEFPLMILFLFFVFLIFCIIPYLIRRKVRKQMQNSKHLGDLVTYEFTEDGIITTTSSDSGKASWGKFKRAISRKYIIILYDTQKQAIVLPLDQIEEQYTEVMDMIFAHMPVPAVRIRRTDKK